jgi:hypothetical protein
MLMVYRIATMTMLFLPGAFVAVRKKSNHFELIWLTIVVGIASLE